MAIHIESAETEELARRVAELTGESLTDAITNSLRERLVRLTRQSDGGLAERLMRIGAACAAIRSCKGISPEDLYDERGLSQWSLSSPGMLRSPDGHFRLSGSVRRSILTAAGL